MSLVKQVRIFSSPARLDEQAFEAIFLENYSKVHAILWRMTNDRFEADDLAAETFWRLWEKPPAQDENLSGWLFRVASRLGYNALRADRRRANYEDHAFLEREKGLDPEIEAERNIERARVRGVLKRMAMRDVQILVLRHSGLSYKEIAATMQLQPGSVGTLLARAEERFERLYEQGDDHAPK